MGFLPCNGEVSASEELETAVHEPGTRESFVNFKNRGIFGGGNNCKSGGGVCVIQY